jgi:predicted phage tail protein
MMTMNKEEVTQRLHGIFKEDLFIEEKDFGFFRAIVNGAIIAVSFFVTLIILNFVVSGLLWAVITRGL